MDNVLLSTAYLPPVEYFALLLSENAAIEREERYQKQSYRNRTVIMNGNGALNLIIPTVHDGRMGIVKDVRIEYVTPWQRAHWRSIESAYNNTPYYLYYKDALKPFYEREFEFLFDFNLQLTQTLMKLLRLDCEIRTTTEFSPYINNDPRLLIHPKQARREDYPFRLKTPYYQVFEDKFGFVPNLSVIDLLFNEGPQAATYLRQLLTQSETR
ncbi:MAG: WbqC family protein [Bacteroidales bacterium]|nr:WbqC family protein [Bacteroidales bacterium]